MHSRYCEELRHIITAWGAKLTASPTELDLLQLELAIIRFILSRETEIWEKSSNAI